MQKKITIRLHFVINRINKRAISGDSIDNKDKFDQIDSEMIPGAN